MTSSLPIVGILLLVFPMVTNHAGTDKKMSLVFVQVTNYIFMKTEDFFSAADIDYNFIAM